MKLFHVSCNGPILNQILQQQSERRDKTGIMFEFYDLRKHVNDVLQTCRGQMVMNVTPKVLCCVHEV